MSKTIPGGRQLTGWVTLRVWRFQTRSKLFGAHFFSTSSFLLGSPGVVLKHRFILAWHSWIQIVCSVGDVTFRYSVVCAGACFVCVRELHFIPERCWAMEGCQYVLRKYCTMYISVNCLLNAWQFYDSVDYAVTALCITCSAMKIYFQMWNIRFWKILCRWKCFL